jgi:hypothetical protein
MQVEIIACGILGCRERWGLGLIRQQKLSPTFVDTLVTHAGNKLLRRNTRYSLTPQAACGN